MYCIHPFINQYLATRVTFNQSRQSDVSLLKETTEMNATISTTAERLMRNGVRFATIVLDNIMERVRSVNIKIGTHIRMLDTIVWI